MSNHRGAYLNSLGNVVSWSIPQHAVFLHVVPMFHCNGWCFPWAITALGGYVGMSFCTPRFMDHKYEGPTGGFSHLKKSHLTPLPSFRLSAARTCAHIPF